MPKSSILDDLSTECTALRRGQRLGQRAATVGFDWPEARQALAKVREEVDELDEVIASEDPEAEELTAELGDILFALVNVARKLDIDAEAAMARTNEKFERRFRFIEDELDRAGRSLQEVSLEDMELLWERAKRAGQPSR